jgi:hypothetical protein
MSDPRANFLHSEDEAAGNRMDARYGTLVGMAVGVRPVALAFRSRAPGFSGCAAGRVLSVGGGVTASM